MGQRQADAALYFGEHQPGSGHTGSTLPDGHQYEMELHARQHDSLEGRRAFDSLLNEYKKFLDDNNWDKIVEVRNEKMKANKEKLGLK